MGRTIFIGDIHGCADEVQALLGRIGVATGDRVIALGDITRKGPSPVACIDLWTRSGFESVLGNNDQKILEIADSWRPRWLARRPDREVLRSDARLATIRSWPLYLDCPGVGAVAVHGGVLPNDVRFNASLAPRDAALELRFVRRDVSGMWVQVPRGKQRDCDVFWADLWQGDRIVVYGHTPRGEVRIHPRAIGLDTGCVYGGKLSAAVFSAPDEYTIVSVDARRSYSR